MTKARTRGAKRAAKRAAAKVNAKIASVAGGKNAKVARVQRQSAVLTMQPTKERQAKGDLLSNNGTHQSEDLLARMHRLRWLARDKRSNTELATAGVKYQQAAHNAGLAGVAAQDLLRVVGAEPGEGAAVSIIKVRKAWDIMGINIASIVHGLLVEGMSVEEAGRRMKNYNNRREWIAEGLTTLRNGLGILSEKSAYWA